MASVLGSIFRTSNKAPVPYVSERKAQSPSYFMGQSGRGKASPKESMEAYGNVGTLFAIVSRLANATGMVEWKLYRKNRDGRRVYREVETRTEVTRHAALDLLQRPNEFMTWPEFCETVQQHVDLTGEGWIVVAYHKIRAAGPIELWPMRPDRVKVVTDANDFLTGYLYCTPDGDEIPLLKEDVIQLRMPNPMDPYRGLGPVQSVMIDLDSSRYASEYNRNFFLNSAEPGGIIEIEDRLDDDEFRELAQRWKEQHQGVANAHRVAILEQGRWVDRRYTMRDMAFPELAELNREAIREAFGYPKAMLGATDDVNKAVAEAQERIFAKWLQVPRLERWKHALNNDLLPLFGVSGEGLEFDYEDPVPEDRMADSQERFTKSQAVSALIAAGFDAQDVLETIGLPEMKWEKPEPKQIDAPPQSADGKPLAPGEVEEPNESEQEVESDGGSE